jgi:toxin ParE1/3/4
VLNNYEVKVMPSADNDILQIYNYIANELGSEDNADNTIDVINDTIISLNKVPKRGMIYSNEPWKSRELRMVFANNYTIFYYVFDKELTVKVIKVAYSGMNFDELLKKLDR